MNMLSNLKAAILVTFLLFNKMLDAYNELVLQRVFNFIKACIGLADQSE